MTRDLFSLFNPSAATAIPFYRWRLRSYYSSLHKSLFLRYVQRNNIISHIVSFFSEMFWFFLSEAKLLFLEKADCSALLWGPVIITHSLLSGLVFTHAIFLSFRVITKFFYFLFVKAHLNGQRIRFRESELTFFTQSKAVPIEYLECIVAPECDQAFSLVNNFEEGYLQHSRRALDGICVGVSSQI